MIRIAAIFLAILVAAQPLAAGAQDRGRGPGGRFEQPFEPPGGPGNQQRGPQPGRGFGGQTISMEQAVAIVARRTPGRLLDASPAGSNYRIVWLSPEGRRIDFLIDASSGAILSANGG